MGCAVLTGAVVCAAAFQGLEYAALAGGFSLVLAAGVISALRFGLPPLRTTDAWTIAFALALTAAAVGSRVFYLSAGAAIGLSLWFIGYFFARTMPATAQRLPLATLGVLGTGAGIVVVIGHLATGSDVGGPFLYRHLFSTSVLVAGFALAASADDTGSDLPWRRNAVIFVAGFVPFAVIGLAGSRGVLVAGAVATLATAVAIPRGRRLAALWFAGGAIAGFVFAELAGPSDAVARAVTLAAPTEVAATRFVLWGSVFPLILERPLLGHGPGLLFAVWPPYRDFADADQGFYAHNVLLDFAVTAGIPATLLLVATVRSTIYAGLARSASRPTWLLGGVVALAVHSLGDFPLLVPVIGLAFGVFSGILAGHAPQAPEWTRRGAPYALMLCVLVIVMLAGYAATSVRAQFLLDDAATAVARGEPVIALGALDRARRWWPSSDVPSFERARLITETVLDTPSAAENPLFGQALAVARADLDRARRLNPLRPDTHRLAARVEMTAGLAGESGASNAARASLERALAVDPRSFAARLELSAWLERQGRLGDAWQVLEDGTIFPRLPEPYLRRTERAERLFYERVRLAGDDDGAE